MSAERCDRSRRDRHKSATACAICVRGEGRAPHRARRRRVPSARMRALVVTNMYPTPERPALGSFVRDQVEALRRRDDVEIELFAFPPGCAPILARPASCAADTAASGSTSSTPTSASPRGRPSPRGSARWSRCTATTCSIRARTASPARSCRSRRSPRRSRASSAGCSAARGRPDGSRSCPWASTSSGSGRSRGRGARAARPRSRRALSPLPARSVAAAQALRPRAGGGGGDAAADDGQRRAGGRTRLDQREQRRARAVAGGGVRPLGDRGAGVRRAGVRDAGRDPPGRLADVDGAYCAPWDREAWRAALRPVLEAEDPRVDGLDRAAIFSADRMAARVVEAWPTWPDSAPLGEPRVAIRVPRITTLYSTVQGVRRSFALATYERPAATPDTPRPCDRRREPAPTAGSSETAAAPADAPAEPGSDRPVPADDSRLGFCRRPRPANPRSATAADRLAPAGPPERPTRPAAKEATKELERHGAGRCRDQGRDRPGDRVRAPAAAGATAAGLDPGRLTFAPPGAPGAASCAAGCSIPGSRTRAAARDLGGSHTRSTAPQRAPRNRSPGRFRREGRTDRGARRRGRCDRGAARRAALETMLREPGIGGTCPECSELHASDAHFCSRCGMPLDAKARAQREASIAAAAQRAARRASSGPGGPRTASGT